MDFWRTWLSLLTPLILIQRGCRSQSVNSDNACTTVYKEHASCASWGDIMLSCPPRHRVYIQYARPAVLYDPGCNINDQALDVACSTETLTYYVRNYICNTGNTCTIRAAVFRDIDSRRCQDYQGENILAYTYFCEPEEMPSISLCNSQPLTKSFVSLVSSSSNSLQQLSISSADIQSIASSNCMCSILVPADTQVVITRFIFEKSDQILTNCAQAVILQDPEGEGRVLICPTRDYVITLGCQPFDREITVYYDTLNTRVLVKFSLNFTVSHDKYISMQCGLRPTTPGPSTTTPTTTTTTTTTTPSTSTVTTTTTTTSTTPSTTTTSTTSTKTVPMTTSTTEPPKTPNMTTVPSSTPTVFKKPPRGNSLPFSTEVFAGILGGGVALLVLATAVIAIGCASRRRAQAAGAAEKKPNTPDIVRSSAASYGGSGIYEDVGEYFATPYETPLKKPPMRHSNSFNYRTDTMPYSAQFRDSNPEVLHNPVYGKTPYNDLFQY